MAPRIGRSRIPEWLAKAGKSQAQLADHLRVSEPYISQVISGKSKLSVENMKATADFCRCRMDELNDWEYR